MLFSFCHNLVCGILDLLSCCLFTTALEKWTQILTVCQLHSVACLLTLLKPLSENCESGGGWWWWWRRRRRRPWLGFIWRHFLFYNKEAKAVPWTVNHVHKVPKEKKKRGTHTCATHRGESDKLNERSGKQDKQEREGMEVLVAVGIQSTVFTVREWLTEQSVCFCASQSALSSSAQCSTGTLHSWDSCLSLRFSLCGSLFF